MAVEEVEVAGAASQDAVTPGAEPILQALQMRRHFADNGMSALFFEPAEGRNVPVIAKQQSRLHRGCAAGQAAAPALQTKALTRD